MLQLLAFGESMEPVFYQILNMSFTASYVFCVILLCRYLLKKSPKVFSYSLWFAMLFRLLCPIALPSPISFLNLLDLKGNQVIMEYVPEHIGMQAQPTVDAGIPILSDTISSILPAPDPHILTSANSLQIVSFILCNLWLFGIYGFMIYTIVSWLRMRRLTSTAVMIEPGVYESEFLASPFAKGLFQPKIYLPTHLSEEDRSIILAHERIHLRRKDPLVKNLFYIALVVHWFNPLVWCAFHLMIRDMEMSCDEAVLRDMGGSVAYSEALLRMASTDQTLKKVSLVGPLAFGESNVAVRIKNVLQCAKISVGRKVCLSLVCILMILSCSCNPASPGTGFMTRLDYYMDRLTSFFDVSEGSMAERLWEHRTAYVGDNSAVGNLLGALTIPGDPGIISKGMELETTEKPYRLIIHYEAQARDAREILTQENDWIYENMVILFTLIDNVDMIETRIQLPDKELLCYAYTRGEAIQAAYGDIKEDFSIASQEDLAQFITMISYKIGSYSHPQKYAYGIKRLTGQILSGKSPSGTIMVTGYRGKTNREYTLEIDLEHAMIYNAAGKRVWDNFLNEGDEVLIGYNGEEVDTLPGYIPFAFYIQLLSE